MHLRANILLRGLIQPQSKIIMSMGVVDPHPISTWSNAGGLSFLAHCPCHVSSAVTGTPYKSPRLSFKTLYSFRIVQSSPKIIIHPHPIRHCESANVAFLQTREILDEETPTFLDDQFLLDGSEYTIKFYVVQVTCAYTCLWLKWFASYKAQESSSTRAKIWVPELACSNDIRKCTELQGY
jgi:hypothetical protein